MLRVALAGFERADPEARFELLYAERHDALAVMDAGRDERLVLRERGDRDRPQHQRTGWLVHIDRRSGAAVEHGRERQPRYLRVARVRERDRRGHAEGDGVVRVDDG